MTTNNSEAIYTKACEVLPGGVSRNTVYRRPHPHYVEHAAGCLITDIEGVTRLDFANNMAALIHGHAHPAIVEAVTAQLQRGSAYTMASGIEVDFAELLRDRTPGFEMLRFVNSGTEAVMAMIKAARAFTGRPKIAKAEGAYHGTYDFAEVSQVANPGNWGDISNPNSVPLAFGTPQGVLDDVVIFPYNDVERTLAILDRHAGELACVLIDPVPHRVGLVPGTADFVEALHAWTRRNDALLCFDEVVTFRVAYGGAQERYSVRPDLTALGKIIGGGFPVGALAGRADVMQVLDPRQAKLPFPHSGTFSANPITMTAGYTAMTLFDHAAVQRLNALTAQAIGRIEEAIRLANVPVSITGAGSMFRMHLSEVAPATYREAWQPKETQKVIEELLEFMYTEEHILMINTFACMFSTVMGTAEVDRLAESLLRTFRALKPNIDAVARRAGESHS
ncbi:MAG: aspartate aminotransferase family protein [Bacteroidia bacterium]|nr:aspartate aminotransferase family protein [Bacteroidia bacterium]